MLNILRLWPRFRSRSGQMSKRRVFTFWALKPVRWAAKSSQSPKVLVYIYQGYIGAWRSYLKRSWSTSDRERSVQNKSQVCIAAHVFFFILHEGIESNCNLILWCHPAPLWRRSDQIRPNSIFENKRDSAKFDFYEFLNISGFRPE